MKADLKKAIALLNEGRYTCVMCKGDQVYTAVQRGVKPLLDWLGQAVSLRGFCAADKVVGKAAAFLYVLLGAEAVYAPVMSKPALETLKKNGLQAYCGMSVDAIRNRTDTGFCPMETAVREIEEPTLAYDIIVKKALELSR